MKLDAAADGSCRLSQHPPRPTLTTSWPQFAPQGSPSFAVVYMYTTIFTDGLDLRISYCLSDAALTPRLGINQSRVCFSLLWACTTSQLPVSASSRSTASFIYDFSSSFLDFTISIIDTTATRSLPARCVYVLDVCLRHYPLLVLQRSV